MSVFDDIGRAAKRGSRSVFHEASHVGGDIQHAITGGVMAVQHAAERGVTDVQHAAERGIHEVEGALPKIAEAVEHVLVPVLEEVMKPIERLVFTVGKDVLEETYRLSREAHEKTASPDAADAFVDQFNKISFYVANAGPISIGMYWRNMWDRAPEIIKELRKAEKGIPAKRHDIIEFVERLGPDALDITISGKLPVIQIGGSIGAWSIPAPLFEHLLDGLLKKAGLD